MHDSFLHQTRADRSQQGDHECSRPEHQTGIDGTVAVERLQDLRDHRGGAEDAEAEDEQEHRRDGEVAALQQMQVDDGVLLPQLPENCRHPAYDRDAECPGDDPAAEPVIDLAAIEEDFECCRAEPDQQDPGGIDLQTAAGARGFTLDGECGRVLHQAVAQVKGEQADRNIDEEDPAPGVVVRDPSAENGADGGRGDDGDGVKCKGRCAFPEEGSTSIACSTGARPPPPMP